MNTIYTAQPKQIIAQLIHIVYFHLLQGNSTRVHLERIENPQTVDVMKMPKCMPELLRLNYDQRIYVRTIRLNAFVRVKVQFKNHLLNADFICSGQLDVSNLEIIRHPHGVFRTLSRSCFGVVPMYAFSDLIDV